MYTFSGGGPICILRLVTTFTRSVNIVIAKRKREEVVSITESKSVKPRNWVRG